MSPRLLSKNRGIKIHRIIILSLFCIIMKLGLKVTGRPWAEGVQEWGAEEGVCPYEGMCNRRLKIA